MLAEALKGLGLQPGRTYRATVEGHEVEVRVLDDAPSPELADQVMLDGIVDVPVRPVWTGTARPGPIELSPPPDIPVDDCAE
jgi:hypothetical protein